ncbi:uncharacterized protein FA14DRAFT_159577 [Meira miltonrushii]|uniref:RRM domain-containing protein n=1 Tax=Meira miltonrushii TaxID=1280837 RepID=A0A316VJ78_9BASI|nr:uncharacterized protein FA14DRAFT_159577 [Meira miltonrushii]PWN37606.1 hypothetical protein FA14DRAFT_159577 [Meira miltonrushii]
MPTTRSTSGAKNGNRAVSNVKRSRPVEEEKGRINKKAKVSKPATKTQAKESSKSTTVPSKDTKKTRPTAISVIDAAEEKEDSDEDDMIALDAGDDDDEEEEEEEEEEVETDSEAEDAEDDDAAILAGFSDVDGADSSDEDEDDDKETKQGTISASGVVKLPSSKDDAVVKARLEKVNKKRKESGQAGKPIVLYFGRVPKTMPESALRSYLDQFGNVKRLRLARNKKTGATKHYAFVEFEDEEVGKIVCETMHNYLLEGRLLQVHIVPKEKQHPSLWVGANRTYRKIPADRKFRVSHNKARTQEQKERAETKLLQRQEKRRKRIKQQGIDYDFEGYTKA